MEKKRDDSSGRYVEKATLDDVLQVFDAVDGPPVVTSADVADATGLSRDSARRKLETLHDRGRVEKRKTAGRVLYWRTGDDHDAESGLARSPSTASGSGVDVEGLTFKRELTPERREALDAWLRYARDEDGGVTKSDFEDWWGDDRAAGTGYSKPGAFWEAFAKAAMKESEKFHKPNARTYRWVGAQ